MSSDDTDIQRQELASAFGANLDELAEYAPVFEEKGIDPFDIYRDRVLAERGIAEKTLDGYGTAFRDFKTYMREEAGRHPACPSEEHIKRYMVWEQSERGLATSTLKKKLRHLNAAYEYWQADVAFPHPADYNPFKLARQTVNLDGKIEKQKYDIPLSIMQEKVQGIKHVRDRAIWVVQLKLGLRATEVCNIKLSEINLDNPEVRECYPEVASSPYVSDYKRAIYIPPNPNSDAPQPGRQGNKSKRAKLLPLDDEARRVLREWLLVRPTCSTPEVFVSKTRHRALRKGDVLDIWHEHFRPEYDETAIHDAVDSHYARHWFTTFWRIEKGMQLEKVRYMRGDKLDADTNDAVNTYIHTHYADIEAEYRDRVFKLGV